MHDQRSSYSRCALAGLHALQHPSGANGCAGCDATHASAPPTSGRIATARATQRAKRLRASIHQPALAHESARCKRSGDEGRGSDPGAHLTGLTAACHAPRQHEQAPNCRRRAHGTPPARKGQSKGHRDPDSCGALLTTAHLAATNARATGRVRRLHMYHELIGGRGLRVDWRRPVLREAITALCSVVRHVASRSHKDARANGPAASELEPAERMRVCSVTCATVNNAAHRADTAPRSPQERSTASVKAVGVVQQVALTESMRLDGTWSVRSCLRHVLHSRRQGSTLKIHPRRMRLVLRAREGKNMRASSVSIFAPVQHRPVIAPSPRRRRIAPSTEAKHLVSLLVLRPRCCSLCCCGENARRSSSRMGRSRSVLRTPALSGAAGSAPV